jgi:hypothetical protein
MCRNLSNLQPSLFEPFARRIHAVLLADWLSMDLQLSLLDTSLKRTHGLARQARGFMKPK